MAPCRRGLPQVQSTVRLFQDCGQQIPPAVLLPDLTFATARVFTFA